ncbi:MAG: hypothetical protein CMJ46_10190 [Planctomyces sp.]|nr:hypothetical protein [Planctomyces sp.]
MPEEIKVHVVDYGRKNLVLRYLDPMTGRQKTKSAGTSKRKEAERAAAKWEAELQQGTYKVPCRISWENFRERYEQEHVAALSPDTFEKISAVLNTMERILNPKQLSNVTTARVSFYQAELRRLGRSEQTIKSHCQHLKAALNWGKRMGLIHETPEFVMPPRARTAKMMKGRPLTAEEFERMLNVTEKVVGKDKAESWKFLLNGLWHSGLRLTEALNLTWRNRNRIWIELGGKHPILRIPAAMEKGNQDRQLPITPQFAEMIQSIPDGLRKGFFFDPTPVRAGYVGRLKPEQVSRIISAIGKKARVKVSENRGKTKFASAHDLRRSYGERLSQHVPAQILMQMMRHESIETTLKYYVGRNAESVSETVFRAFQEGVSI